MAYDKPKKRVNLTIDEVVWKKAGVLHLNRSGICEDALRTAVGMGNDEEIIERKMKEAELTLKMGAKQLKQNKEVEAFKEESGKVEQDSFDFLMETAKYNQETYDHVGIDKLEALCIRKNADLTPILNECKKRGYDLKNFAQY